MRRLKIGGCHHIALATPNTPPEGHHTGNNRNGYSGKTVKGAHGEVEIDVLRDRNGTFEPQLIRKGQTRDQQGHLFGIGHQS